MQSKAYKINGREFDEKVIEDLYVSAYDYTQSLVDFTDLEKDEIFSKMPQKIMRCLELWRGEAALKTTIIRAVINASNTLRKRKNTRPGNVSLETYKGVENDFGLSVPTDQKRAILEEAVQRELLGKLSEEHREAVVLYYFDGLTHKEMAAVIGVSSGTMRSRLHYAKVNLKKIVDGNGFRELRELLGARGY